MKKKIKNESGSSRIQKAKEKSRKKKTVKEVFEKIFYSFEMPGSNNTGIDSEMIEGMQISEILDEIVPWQNLVDDTGNKFDRLYEAIKISFGLGYVVGQMLDVTDVNTKVVEDFLREKKSLYYFPHERKAG